MTFQCSRKLSCTDPASYPPESYDDRRAGPVKPGFQFYRWLARGPPLPIPIPDTVLITKQSVKHVYTNDKGQLTTHTVNVEDAEDRDRFLARALHNHAVLSQPLTVRPDPPEALHNRFVSVLKRPLPTPALQYSAQQCEPITPLTLQATLLNACDLNIAPCVVQKFIKSGGMVCMVVVTV